MLPSVAGPAKPDTFSKPQQMFATSQNDEFWFNGLKKVPPGGQYYVNQFLFAQKKGPRGPLVLVENCFGSTNHLVLPEH